MTKKALSEAAGVSTKSISSYENGTQEPEKSTLLRLAQALEFPVSFFGRPPIDEIPIGASSFRALTKMTATQRDKALGAGTLAVELSNWIDERFQLPSPSIPRYVVDPETAAEAVRNEWGLGERPIKNMVHLLESRGIRVFSLAEENREVDAFSTWYEGAPFVFLNTMKTAEHSRMDAAHELGHLVLHAQHEVPGGRYEEREAQHFASAFLMPMGTVIANAPRSGRLEDLIRAKRHWSVALSNLTYRMHSLGLLTEWQYRSLFIEISSQGYRTKEPDGIERETSQLLTKVFQSLRDEGISKADIARDLAISTEELNRLIFGLVLTHLPGGGEADRGSREKAHLKLVEPLNRVAHEA